jgi:AbrB family looped-hinge helix DNA binding protein
MQLTLSKWGNSIGLRIPKEYRDHVGLKEGSKVVFEIQNNKLVITPVSLQSASQNINLSSSAKMSRTKPHPQIRSRSAGENS